MNVFLYGSGKDNEKLSPRESMLLAKYIFWTMGISPREFSRCAVRDVRELLEIHNVVLQKKKSNQNTNKVLMEMMNKWS